MLDLENGVPTLRVLLLARYDLSGASSRVRYYNFVEPLSRRGIKVDTQHLIDNQSLVNFYAGRPRRVHSIARAYAHRLALLTAMRTYDVVWIEKEALPKLPLFMERWFYSCHKTPTVLDFDDFWIGRHQIDRKSASAGARDLDKLKFAMSAASVVTAANVELSQAIYELTGSRPVVIANHIDVTPYREAAARRDMEVPTSRRRVTVGWIGTPYTAALYLPPIGQILNVLSRQEVCETVLIGADNAALEISGRRIPWSLDNEATDVASLDIGIQPLGDSAFDQCKSGWKLYQYMAAGRPVIATRNAFTSSLIEDGVTGFLVDTVEEFEIRLRQLVADSDLRTRMGSAGQNLISTQFGIEAGADKLATLFRGLAKAG